MIVGTRYDVPFSVRGHQSLRHGSLELGLADVR
jgi:hypothetical protein